jgi:Sulfotransferase domain
MVNLKLVKKRVEKALERRSKYIYEILDLRVKETTSLMRMLPGFLIIGTAKGGTTSLHQYLEKHPNVGRILNKEVNFYNYNYEKGLGWYRSYFPLKMKRVMAGDSSPNYMIQPHAPRRAFQVTPNAKIIALLRNPIDRAFSHHNMNLMRKEIHENLSFEDAIEAEEARISAELSAMLENEDYVGSYIGSNYSHFSYLRSGFYADQLEQWTKFFPRDQILVIQSEVLFESPSTVYNQVLKFLDLPEHELKEYKNANPRSYASPMNPDTRKHLNNYFRTHNERLYDFLGTSYNWD